MAVLNGHNALVTGGGRGIGRALALKLAELGANVVVTARSKDEINAVADEVRALGVKALAIPADVANYADVERVITQATDDLGTIDIIINNAGTTGAIDRIENTDPEMWATTQMVNIVGAYNVIRATVAGMLDKGWGRVVNIGSGAGLGTGMPRMGAYSVSKAALDMLSRSAASELGERGVLVNSVYPGVVETVMTRGVSQTPTAGPVADRFNKMFEEGSMLTPEQSADLIIGVLFSDKNGEVLDVRDDGEALKSYLAAATA